MMIGKRARRKPMASIKVANSHVDEVITALQSKKNIILEEWGLIAEAYASEACPVDTGRLRASISHDHDDNTMMVGTNVEYAPYVELGTKNAGAQPFLRPAIENHMGEYKETMNQALLE